jgi:hypothetical protein
MEPFDYLKQNASEMATVVETYLVEETADLIYDGEKLDKWNALVAELGLKGQTHICKPDKSPIPFLVMNQEMTAIFETLCPTQVSVENYNQMPIPVEILDLIALSRKENYFEQIYIWYDEKQKDPVCIGEKRRYRINIKSGGWYKDPATGGEMFFSSKESCAQYIKDNGITGCEPYCATWDGDIQRYLLGRWADVKQSMNELRQRARERFVSIRKSEIEKEITDRKRQLEDLNFEAGQKFGLV